MKPNIKLAIFILVTILIGVLFWYSLYRLLFLTEETIEVPELVFPVVSFIIFGLAVCILFLLVGSFRYVFWTFVVIGGALLAFFGIDIFIIIGLLIFVGLCFLSWRIFQIEKTSRVRMSLIKILPRALPALFTAFALIISLIWFVSPGLEKGLADIKIPRGIFDFTIAPLEEFISSRVPIYKKGMSADEFILVVEIVQALSSGEKEKLSYEFLKEAKSLKVFTKESVGINEILQDEELKMAIENEVNRKLQNSEEVEAVRSEYSEKLKIGIKEGESATDTVYNMINFQLNVFKRAYEEVLPAALAVGLFLTLKAVSFPFMWLLIFITIVVFKLLITFKAIRIEEVDVKKEIITL